jgi:hypothetical protein
MPKFRRDGFNFNTRESKSYRWISDRCRDDAGRVWGSAGFPRVTRPRSTGAKKKVASRNARRKRKAPYRRVPV